MPRRPAPADRPAPRPRLFPAAGESAAAAAFAAVVLLAGLPAAWRDGGEVEAVPVRPIVFRFDANAATAAEWELLPRVGPVLAARLAGGRYDRPADLLAVKGVGPKTLEEIRPWLRFPGEELTQGEATAGEPWESVPTPEDGNPLAPRFTDRGA